jgi:hypothetical protein
VVDDPSTELVSLAFSVVVGSSVVLDTDVTDSVVSAGVDVASADVDAVEIVSDAVVSRDSVVVEVDGKRRLQLSRQTDRYSSRSA